MHTLQINNNRGRFGVAAVALAGLLAASSGALADDPPDSDHDSDDHSYHEKLDIKDDHFVDLGDKLLAKAKVVGLSKHHEVKVVLRATAEIKVECINPGGNKPPGAQPEPQEVEVKRVEKYSHHEIEHGKLQVAVKTRKVKVDAGEFCPNPNWTANVKHVRFLDAKLKVAQKDKDAALLCTFSPPTKDGKVSSKHVECHKLQPIPPRMQTLVLR